MRFQTFDGIRLEHFAFKFDLRHFLETRRVKTLSFFPLKTVFHSLKQENRLDQGPYPFFFISNLHK